MSGASARGPERPAEDRVPLGELVDLAALSAGEGGGRPPTPAAIRRALPAGWVLDADGAHARRDERVLFRDSWVLITGLVVFGAAALGLFWGTFPRGWRGVGRALALLGVMLVLGGWIAPRITRALQRR